MEEAAKQAKREYEREWRRKNAERVRAYREKYWMNKAAENKKKPEKPGKKEGGSG